MFDENGQKGSDDVKQDADEDTQIVVTEYSDLWSGILQ